MNSFEQDFAYLSAAARRLGDVFNRTADALESHLDSAVPRAVAAISAMPGADADAPQQPAPTGVTMVAPTQDESTPPWESQEQAAAAAPAPERKGGRRTNEEIAAENGVNLEDVKRWLGDKRITKAGIEEYAKLARSGQVATPTQPAQQAAPAAPQQPMPTTAASPFGQQPAAPIEPPQWTGQQPTQPAPEQQAYGTWPMAPGFDPADPFGSQ